MAYKKRSQPGVMLYFDMLPAIMKLPDEKAGKLLKAILFYAKFEQEPDFSVDNDLAIFWTLMEAAIDRDREKYKAICQKRSRYSDDELE